MPFLLVLMLCAACWAWFRLFRSVHTDRLLRVFLALLCTLLQTSTILTLLGFTGLLVPSAALGVHGLITLWVLRLSIRQIDTEGATSDALVVATPERPPLAERLALGATAVLALPVVLRLLLFGTLWRPWAYDGIAYHLPPLVEALQHGHFINSNTLIVYGVSYPKSIEMLFLWLMLDGRGDWVLLGQALFLPLGVTAIALLARWIGLSKPLSLAAGLSALFIPIVMVQASTNYIDVATGALLLSSMVCALFYRSGYLPGRSGILLTLASLGFLLGTKFNSLLMVGLIGVVAFGPDLWHRKITRVHLFGLLLLLPGLSWYVANLIWFQNPLWPFAIPGAEWLAPSLIPVETIMTPNTPPTFLGRSNWFNAWEVWRELGHRWALYSYDSRHGGLGPIWFVLGLPAIPFFVWQSWWQPERRKAVLLLLLFFILFITTPSYWWPRYSWWITALGLLAFASLWVRMPAWSKMATGCAFLLLAGLSTILAFSGGTWRLDTVARTLQGEYPTTTIYADPVLDNLYRGTGEVIGISDLSWYQYYLYGRSFGNRLVLVKAENGADLEQLLRHNKATLYLLTPSVAGQLKEIGHSPCFEEVISSEATGLRLFHFNCH